MQVKSPSPLTKQNSVDIDPEPDDSVLFKEHPVISALKVCTLYSVQCNGEREKERDLLYIFIVAIN